MFLVLYPKATKNRICVHEKIKQFLIRTSDVLILQYYKSLSETIKLNLSKIIYLLIDWWFPGEIFGIIAAQEKNKPEG